MPASTWYVKSGTGGSDDGSSAANAAESIEGLLAAQAVAGGDTILVDKTHSYAKAGQINYALPEATAGILYIKCVDFGSAYALATGAIEETTGNFGLFLSTYDNPNTTTHYYGMTFRVGGGTPGSSSVIQLQTGARGSCIFENCTFIEQYNGASLAWLKIGSGSSVSTVMVFRNCTFTAAAATQFIAPQGGQIEMYNCVISGGTAPTTAFKPQSVHNLIAIGCNFAATTNFVDQSAVSAQYHMVFRNCAGPSTYVTGAAQGTQSGSFEFFGCGPADAVNGPNVMAYGYVDPFGSVIDTESVYLASGASQGSEDDGTATSYSLKMTPTSSCSVVRPLYGPWIAVKVTSTGSKTITLKAADTEAAVLKDTELALEVAYMGGANLTNSPQCQVEGTYPLVSGVLSRDIYATGSNLTDTNETWTGISATDTYTLSKTVTVDYQGFLYVRPVLSKNTTNPVYIDGKIGVA